jgi:hypothetical protein
MFCNHVETKAMHVLVKHLSLHNENNEFFINKKKFKMHMVQEQHALKAIGSTPGLG